MQCVLLRAEPTRHSPSSQFGQIETVLSLKIVKLPQKTQKCHILSPSLQRLPPINTVRSKPCNEPKAMQMVPQSFSVHQRSWSPANASFLNVPLNQHISNLDSQPPPTTHGCLNVVTIPSSSNKMHQPTSTDTQAAHDPGGALQLILTGVLGPKFSENPPRLENGRKKYPLVWVVLHTSRQIYPFGWRNLAYYRYFLWFLTHLYIFSAKKPT